MGRKKHSRNLSEHATGLVDQLTPHMEAARDKVRDDYLPHAQAVAADAASSTREMLADAASSTRHVVADAASSTRHVVADAAAQARDALPMTEPPEKSHRLRKLLALLGIAGLGTAVFKKLRAKDTRPPTYTRPQPVPTQSSQSASAPHPEATPLGDAAQAVASTADQGGATPGELLADADEGPHPVTTPEKPVEEVDVSAEPEPKTKG